MAKNKSKTSKSDYVAVVVGISVVAILLFFVLTRTEIGDAILGKDDDYTGGVSEEEWFDGVDLDWTIYEHPDESIMTAELPNEDFNIEEHVHYEDLNVSNLTELGGFVANWQKNRKWND